MWVRRLVLVAIVMHNSVHTVLMRYTRSRPVPVMYNAAEAVMWMELIKLGISIILVYASNRTKNSGIIKELFMSDIFKIAILALMYTLQSTLFYIGATSLDAAPFIVTSQLKILTTGLFSLLILKRRLFAHQWLSLFSLVLGVCLVQTPDKEKVASGHWSPFGFMCVLAACTLSGLACVWFEAMLKSQKNVSIWLRNVQLSLCALPISFVVFAMSENDLVLLAGFDAIVWTMVVWYALGGIIVACVMKYADNIVKNFAVSVAVVISTILSMWVFDYEPGLLFVIGAAMVLVSIYVFNTQISDLPDSMRKVDASLTIKIHQV